MARRVPVLLGLLVLAGFLPACKTTLPPPKPPPPDPFDGVVAALEAKASRPGSVDAQAILARLKRLAPDDPEALLAAFLGTGLILENFQSQISEKDLARMGQPSAPSKELPILQKIILDGGDGIFSFWYLHRVRSAGTYEVKPGDPARASRGGDVVAMESRLLAARFLRREQVFDLRKAEAWFQSPDWRVNMATGQVLLVKGYRDLSKLKRHAFDLLAKSGGDRARVGAILPLLRGDVPKRSAVEKRSADLAARFVNAFLSWYRQGGDDSLWRSLFEEWGRLVSGSGLAPVDCLRALEAGLLVFGHGSKFPALARSGEVRVRKPLPSHTPSASETHEAVKLVEHPRTYVRVFSPRLEGWFETILANEGGRRLPVALAVLGSADPYLEALFSERHRKTLIESLLGSMASAPPLLRLLAAMALEKLTGCIFPGFDPFGSEAGRLAAVEEMKSRFLRTGFQGLGEEIERKRRQNSVNKALETVAILQRRFREKHDRFCGDPGALFGSPDLARAAGFEHLEDGSWGMRFGFRFEMEACGDGFSARATGKLWKTERETVFRYRSEVETVEILPR